jgi:hypothetical protein
MQLLTHFYPAIRERMAKLKQDMEDAKAKLLADTPMPSPEKPPSASGDTLELSSARSTKDPEPVKTPKMDVNKNPEIDYKGEPIDSDADRADLAEARYTHVKVLVDFIQEELADVLDLRSRISSGTQETIRFEDLWHLFTPGDIIYYKENDYEQLYKVFSVTGGQSLKRARTREEAYEISDARMRVGLRNRYLPDKDEDEEESIEKMLREEGSGIGIWTPFRVDCYCMGYDGMHVGPIALCKKIRPYVGERKITTLPMYPLCFHPKNSEFLRTMQERGRKFLFAGGHKSYDGRTVAMKRYESRVDLQSDVYVDFDAYYQSNPGRKPTVGPLLRTKQNAAEEEESIAPGRVNFRSLSGHEVDTKLSDTFLTKYRSSLERFKPEEDEVSLEMLALMPHYVVGYAFQVRQWCKYDRRFIRSHTPCHLNLAPTASYLYCDVAL